MKRCLSLQLVLASGLLLCATNASAEQRPRYGGVLRVDVRESAGKRLPQVIAPLVYETLVRTDVYGQLAPALATAWHSENDEQRWIFAVRPDVTFPGGTPLTPSLIVQQLAASNPQWHITAGPHSVTIEADRPSPHLPWVLADARFAIMLEHDGIVSGTGPFRISQQNISKLVLEANDDYWGGRPFVNAIEIALNRSYRDQRLDFDTARADIVELAPENLRRAQQERQPVLESDSTKLLALRFDRLEAGPQDLQLRTLQRISLAIDRAPIASTLTLRTGEPADSLLPNWMTGYDFLLTTSRPTVSASSPPTRNVVTIAYPIEEPLYRIIAERIALNARDAGVPVTVRPEPSAASAHLTMLAVPSENPFAAFESMMPMVSASKETPTTYDALFAAESSAIETYAVIPIIHLPSAYLIAPRVHGVGIERDGHLHLEDAWIESASSASTRAERRP